MHSFILKRQPKSFNGWHKASVSKKEGYKADIEKAFREFYPTHSKLEYELYGVLYYFFKKDFNSDADNLSKPFWDCLSGFLYHDDRQVKLRTVGSFDLSKNDFSILDFSGLEGRIITDLLEAFDSEEHIVYIECGILNYSMFKFSLEPRGN
jgi:Holliday junction resolvase RusA-like endonuclease